MDDFCIDRLYSRRWENWDQRTRKGTLLTTQQFIYPERELCFGDDTPSVAERQFSGQYRQPKVVKKSPPPPKPQLVAHGYWKRVSTEGGGYQIRYSDVYTVSKEAMKTWSNELETSLATSLAVSTTVGVETDVGAASAKAETTVSTEITAGLRAALERTEQEAEGKETTTGQEIHCTAPNTPSDEVVWMWRRTVIDRRHPNKTFAAGIPSSCDFTCKKGVGAWTAPDWSPGEKVGTCTLR